MFEQQISTPLCEKLITVLDFTGVCNCICSSTRNVTQGINNILNMSDFVTICASKIMMARPRSNFANTFPYFTGFLSDVSAVFWYSTVRTIAAKHVQSDASDSQQVFFRSPVIKD